jgi:hypothetical protein
MITTRLLMGGGGSAMVVPTHFALTTAPDGGWLPLAMTHPRAVYAGGKTFFGWIDGTTGDVRIAAWNHATRAIEGPTTLNPTFAIDDHNAPAILVRSSDQRLVVVYCSQATPTSIRKVISANPLDVTNWSSESTFSPAGSNYLYTTMYQMAVTGPSRIYVYWKDFPSNTHMREATSSNGGSSFAGGTIIWTSTNAYWVTASDGDSRIDYVVTDIAPSVGVNKLYHFYQDTSLGQLYASDGTTITTPATPANATLIYSGAEAMWPYSMTYTADGRPVVACATQETGVQYREIRYVSGTTWDQHLIVATTEGGFFGNQAQGIAQEDGNPDRVFLGRDVAAGDFEIFEYVSADDGDTWTQLKQVTTGSAPDFPYGPAGVKDFAADLAFLWLTGTYTDFDDYSVGTIGSS